MPQATLNTAARLTHWVGENAKTTRAYLKRINALVPLANMFGYINNLRSMSQGRASYTMQFDHYAQVPGQVAEEIKKKYA